MPSPLIVAIGMPRAGSGWHYNLIHDLVVASGGRSAREIRRQFLLQSILTEVNCNIGAFTTKRLLPVMIPTLLNNTFVIKAHAEPSSLAIRFIENRWIKSLYIYRDPRDALLSAYEYGQRKRESKRSGPFSDLTSIEKAIVFMTEYIKISESWLACKQVLATRYEDFVLSYLVESQRLVDFLGLDPQKDAIRHIIQKYQPAEGDSNRPGTHFVKGRIGRYREKLTKEQQQLCIESFGGYLKKMGYSIP